VDRLGTSVNEFVRVGDSILDGLVFFSRHHLFSHTVKFDRQRLLQLLSHEILVKIWDGKEYCAARTKLDKPRINRALSRLDTGKTVACD
jgi:hypothetical protein